MGSIEFMRLVILAFSVCWSAVDMADSRSIWSKRALNALSVYYKASLMNVLKSRRWRAFGFVSRFVALSKRNLRTSNILG